MAAARGALEDILSNYQGFRKCVVILVFDAYKDRVGRVFHVPLRVVGELGRNLLLIAAGLVPPQGAGQAAPPSGVGGDLSPT